MIISRIQRTISVLVPKKSTQKVVKILFLLRAKKKFNFLEKITVLRTKGSIFAGAKVVLFYEFPKFLTKKDSKIHFLRSIQKRISYEKNIVARLFR